MNSFFILVLGVACAEAENYTPIIWKAHPKLALDTDGHGTRVYLLEQGAITGDHSFTPSQYWNTDSDKIIWSYSNFPKQCMETTASTNGAPIIIDDCKSSMDDAQKWARVKTTNGYKIQLKGTNKCANVVDLKAENWQGLELWDCNNDEMQSFADLSGASTINV